MAGNGDDEITAESAAPRQNPVLLTGFVSGPNIIQNPSTGAQEWHYQMRPATGSRNYLDIDWRNIWWIAGYPATAQNMAGAPSDNLGQKSMWLEASAIGNAASFLSGQIIAGYDVSTCLAEMNAYNNQNAGAGPMGTSYPACLCGH
jgi:hypothetical protein